MTQSAAAKRPVRKKPVAKDHLSIQSNVVAKTEPQRMMIEAYIQNLNVVAYGSAGSGKSYIACYLALRDLFEGVKDKIVIVRSAVATRDQGYLPGSLDEKSAVFTIPYKQIINSLCKNGTAWDILVKKGMIEFVTTSYVRGITLEDAVVIFDEFQSAGWHETNSVITRLGENCQIIICGDSAQNDLIKSKHDLTGFHTALEAFKKLPEYFECIQFTMRDCVRSGLCRAWLGVTETS